MTQDEVVHLCEALLEESKFTPATIRGGAGEVLANLSDEDFQLAVRFAYGDRPTMSEPFIRRSHPTGITEDESARRLAALEELEEETPAGPIYLGDGVTLP